MIVKIKKIVQKYSGMLSVFRYIPFSVRLGKDYNFHKKQLVDYDSKSAREKDDYHYRKLKKIVEYAYENIHFYKFYYNSKGFEPSDFKSLSDFSKVPIITKSDLKKFDLSQRSNLAKKAMKINTGGTSGAPLDFFC